MYVLIQNLELRYAKLIHQFYSEVEKKLLPLPEKLSFSDVLAHGWIEIKDTGEIHVHIHLFSVFSFLLLLSHLS